MNDDIHFMQKAMLLAIKAQEMNEVPVGAIVVKEHQVLGEGWNQPISSSDPTAHAEILALRAAAKQTGNYRLVNCTLYVTLEPCMMCVGAIIHSRIQRLVFGAFDSKFGDSRIFDFVSTKAVNHCVEIKGGILKEECGACLKAFFQKKRIARLKSDE